MISPKMLPKQVLEMLNSLIPQEHIAFYMYKSAANWCQNNGFTKAAKYFNDESKQELEHSDKLQAFIVDWNCTPELATIAKPQLTFDSLLDVIQKAYKLEYDLYETYEDVSTKILTEGDVCTFDFLAYFRNIQVKSVAEYSDMLNVLEGVNTDNKFELLMLEEKLFA